MSINKPKIYFLNVFFKPLLQWNYKTLSSHICSPKVKTTTTFGHVWEWFWFIQVLFTLFWLDIKVFCNPMKKDKILDVWFIKMIWKVDLNCLGNPPPKKTLVAKECSVSVCHSQIRPSLFTSGFKKRWWEWSPRCFITRLHRPVSDITAATSIFYIQFLVLFLDTGTHRHQHHECEDWNSLTAS